MKKKTTKKKAKKTVKKDRTVTVNCNFEAIPIIDNWLDHDPIKIFAVEFSEKLHTGDRIITGFYFYTDDFGLEYEGNKEMVGEFLDCFYPYTNIFNAEEYLNENRCGRDDNSFKEVRKRMKKNIRLVKKLKKAA